MRIVPALASLSTLLLLPAVAAQIAPERALVATLQPGPVATSLLEVDLATGSIVPLSGGFPSDALSALSVALDPNSHDAFVVLDAGAVSRVVRLTICGSSICNERLIGNVAGSVTDLAFGGFDEVLLTVGGAQGSLVALPRNGGSVRVVAPFPRASTVSVSGFDSSVVVVGQSGALPATDPQLTLVDPISGFSAPSQVPMTGYGPVAITGHLELETSLGHNIITNEDGTVSVGSFFFVPQVLDITPVLPPGGTKRLRGMPGYPMTVLGNAAHPFLKRVHNLSPGIPQTWTILAGPLPGNPVDFDVAPSGVARVAHFGEHCSSLRLQEWGRPFLGNSGFAVQAIEGAANAPLALAVGLSDTLFAGIPLPVVLPGGCRLFVDSLIGLPATSDANGFGAVAIPVPNVPGLAGALYYAQWLQVQPGLVTSEAGALFLGT